MKNARLAVAVLLAIAIAANGAQTGFKLTAPDKSFEISFPTEPRHEQYTNNSGSIRVEMHSYTAESSKWKFILTYAHLTPAPSDLKPDDAINSAVSGTVANVRGTLVSQEQTTVAGHTAKAVKVSIGSKTVMDGRFVYAKPRVYQLLVLYDKGTPPPFEQEFFSSFTIR
jgi:hypothetical protein